jgi:hypothetical protein
VKNENNTKNKLHRQSDTTVSETQQTKSIPPLLFHTWKIPPQSAKEIQY